MATSKLQSALSKALREYDDILDIKENHRPDWLITEEGARLELDFYIESIDLAVEVQGAQHYVYTPHFHRDYSDFQLRLYYDEVKREICRKRGITLMEIDSDEEIDAVLSEIAKREEIARLRSRRHIFQQVQKRYLVAKYEQRIHTVLKLMRKASAKSGGHIRQKALHMASKLIEECGQEVIDLTLSDNDRRDFFRYLKALARKTGHIIGAQCTFVDCNKIATARRGKAPVCEEHANLDKYPRSQAS